MRSKTIFGALLVSVALCSQAFSFELLDRVLGLNGGGCGECNACAKVAPCQPCAKACVQPCAPAACCEKACCEPRCKVCRPTPVRDLFANVKEMFEAKGCVCDPVGCCETAKCCPEPACCPVKCRKVRCERPCAPCAPACKVACKPCAPVCKAACEPVCEKVCKPKCHKLYRRPVVELLESLFCCDNECGVGCDPGCGPCGGTVVPGKVPAGKTPEKAAPLPDAPPTPKADTHTSAYQTSRVLVRN
jgi:hypothetical protein